MAIRYKTKEYDIQPQRCCFNFHLTISNNKNNLYCALDTKEEYSNLKAIFAKKREHSNSEIAKANRADRLGHAGKKTKNI